MVVLLAIPVALYLLYFYGWIPVTSKRAVTFIGTGGLGRDSSRGSMGATFTACTGQTTRILRFRESRSYSFHLTGRVSQGSVTVQVLNSDKQPVLILCDDSPSGILSAQKGQRYYLRIRFTGASGDYRLDWS